MAECEHLARTSAYFDGGLAAEEEGAAADHLATCAECQALLADAVGIDQALSAGRNAAGAVRADEEVASQAQRVDGESRASQAQRVDGESRASQAQRVDGESRASQARRVDGETRGPRGKSPDAPARRRWVAPAAVALVAAAAAVLAVYLARPKPAPEAPRATLALAADRAVEARFTGAAFAGHRTLGTLRGAQARESISLAAMAELERRGDAHDLVAALAAGGDLSRAEELAAHLPTDAASDSDRAALALAANDAERALRFAYRAIDRDPTLPAAWWNVALAARALGLSRVASDAFGRVARLREPGWSAEAQRDADGLAPELARDDGFAELQARGLAMVAGGAPLSTDDVARYPAFVRYYFHEAARVAADRAHLDALRPLAKALDDASGLATAAAALDRADPAIGARFGAAYRALVTRTASPADAAKLIDDLRAAGRAADDLRAGAIILAGQAGPRVAELEMLVRPWRDPWLSILVERERIHAAFPGEDLRAEAPLAAALAACTGDAWALRCGQLAQDLGELADATGRHDVAEQRAEDAVARFRRALAPPYLQRALAFAAEQHRIRGRTARARAEFEELALAAGRDCDVARFADAGRAGLALLAGDLSRVRAALPPAAVPPGCSPLRDTLAFSTAIDLARRTHDPADVRVAEQWIAERRRTAPAADDDGTARVGEARIAQGDAAAAADRDLRAWLASRPPTTARFLGDVRTWGTATLVADAGARGDWATALADVAAEHPRELAAPCVLAASADDVGVTIAIRTPAGAAGAQLPIAYEAVGDAQLVPPALVEQLRGCAAIAVLARPPLHGRSDLLPPELPWAFAGDAPPHAGAAAPPRTVEIVDAQPPDPLLPRLAPAPGGSAFDATVSGAAATPSRVLAAIGASTYAEVHAHGIASATDDDAAYLALSPEGDGRYALRADAVRAAKFTRAPLVVLAACRAATVAAYRRQRFSLPDAFLAAGARAVVAADLEIPDAEARAVFDQLRARALRGEPVAAAVAAIRAASAPGSWIRHLIVFE